MAMGSPMGSDEHRDVEVLPSGQPQNSKNKSEFDGMEKMTFSHLWRYISPDEKPRMRHHALTVIYRRLKKGEDPGLIIPDTVNNVTHLLKDPALNSKTKGLLCYTIQALFSLPSLGKLFVRFGILQILLDLSEVWVTVNRHPSKAETMLFDAVLAFLETVSSQDASYKNQLMELGILRIITNLCAPHCLATYKYGSEYYATFNEWALGVFPHLVGQVAVVHPDILQEAYTESLGEDYANLHLPETVNLIALYNTANPNEDVDIAAKMKERKGAWSCMNDIVPSLQGSTLTVSSEDTNWRTIYVTSLTESGMFWAQVNCQESFQIIHRISDVLEKWPQKSVLSEAPTVGTLLAYKDEAIGYARFQVMGETDESTLRVRALDYGSVSELSWKNESVFEIEPEMGIDDIPPQAQLCRLKGVSPPPANVTILQSCVSIIRNLGTESHIYHQNDHLGSTAILRTLHYLCLCSEPAIVKSAAQAITNLASNDIMRAKLLSTNTLDVLIDSLKKYTSLLEDEAAARAVYSTIGALSQIIFRCPELKNEFYRLDGLLHILNIIKVKNAPAQVQTAAKKLLVVFIGKAKPVDVINQLRNGKRLAGPRYLIQELDRAVHGLGLRKKEFLKVTTSDAPSGSSRPSSVSRERPSRSSSRQRYKSLEPDPKEAALDVERLAEDNEEETGEEILSTLVGGQRKRPRTPTSGGETSDGELLATYSRPLTSESEGEGALRILETSTAYKQFSDKRAFIKGRKVPFTNDLHHDIRPFESIEKISKKQIISAVIGLLNTGEGGSIYIGILRSREVRGLCVPRAQRDVLRTSIDSLLTSVEPTVTWMYYEIKYHQVISFSNSASTEEPVYKNIKDNFVIEIKIKCTVDVVYTTHLGEIFLRVDGTTDEITMQQLRSHVMLKEEKRKLDEIKTLEKELSIWSGQLLKNQDSSG